jgi:transposase, IS5 family
MTQIGFFDLPDHLRRLSEAGDPLETMAQAVDFEAFRPVLDEALAYSDGAKGGRPPYDSVAMFKALILAAQNNVSDARMEFLIRDRLSWMRFLGFELGWPTPDENTIRHFREKLTRAGAIGRLFDLFGAQLRGAGYLAMGGQIVDATLVAAPRQRNTAAEKEQIKAGMSAAEIWPDEPARAAQKDVDARWTVKTSRPREADTAKRVLPTLAIPVFGYKSRLAIDRRFGFIRSFAVTDAARHDGALLRELVRSDNTASEVWADTAYRSRANEAWLASRGRVSRIHQKKPRGRPMAERTRKANARKSAVRVRIEHVFAHQKARMGLFIRTIGQARAEAKIGLANLAYNLQRFIFHERRLATG